MDWKRGEVASFCQSLLLKIPPRVKFLLDLNGLGLGASGLDGPSASSKAINPHFDALLGAGAGCCGCLLYTSPSPRDYAASRMPSSA